MKTFNKKLKAILLLIGIVAFTIPTFATTADAGADKTLNITPSRKAVYLKGSGTGEEPLTYKWYEDERFIGRGAGRWYVITKSGEHNITLVVTDANGVKATDTMVVTVNKATANAGEEQESNSTLVHLDGSGTGKVPLKYKWYEKGHFIGEGQSYDYNISQNGQHEITLVVTDANGAKATDKVIVTINSGVDTPLTANAGPDKTLNITPSNRAVHLKGSGTGKAPLSYKWYESSKYIGSGASRWYVLTQNGEHNITLVVADVDGNEANDTMMVTVTNNVLLTKEEPLVPANCLGHITKSGVDTNGNGVLDEDEVTSTEEHYDEGTPLTREELIAKIDNGDDVTQVNTCKITDMSRLFDRDRNNSTDVNGDATFNQDISGWNTGSVTNMFAMFRRSGAFNQDISSWDVSKVTDMSYMFSFTSFNQPLDGWDVSSVQNMREMFSNSQFNQPLNSWDVSNVTDMAGMFKYADLFVQPLDGWDVSKVTNMEAMFQATGASNGGFNQPLNSWNVSNVTNMSKMFTTATAFNQPLDEWDVSSVTNMREMFFIATAFNQDISNWDVSNVTDHYNFADTSALEDAHNPFYRNYRPDLVLLGNEYVSITVGSTYTDSGAIAIDHEDGNITSDIQVTGLPIDTSVEGNYTITYSVSDSEGKMANVVRRNVRVYVPNSQYTRDDTKEIVTDHITNLQWQDNEEAKTVEKTWYGAKNYCSNLGLGGYHDWYLPSKEELKTIGDTTYGTPSINPIFQNIEFGFYWSSSFYGHDNPSYEWEEAWGVFFGFSNEEVRLPIPASYYVRCVRKGIPTVTTTLVKKTGQTISYYPKDDGDYQKGVTPSYIRDDAKEIVTDNITKLQWQDDEEVKTIRKTWQSANNYCSNLNLGGYSDWRLPTIVELQSIVDNGKYNPAIDTVFVNYTSNDYWVSTSYAGDPDTYRWFVNFKNGSTNIYYNSHDDNSFSGNVRCVREGQDAPQL